jgi:hypothetical protein
MPELFGTGFGCGEMTGAAEEVANADFAGRFMDGIAGKILADGARRKMRRQSRRRGEVFFD